MSKNQKFQYFMGVVEVEYSKEENGDTYYGSKKVNCLTKALKKNDDIDFQVIRSIQNNAHSLLLSMLNDEKAVIVNSTVLNIIRCGYMKDEEFKLDEQVH